MGAAVESVVIDVIVVREAGGVSNETGSCFCKKTMTAVTVVTAMTVIIYMGEKKNELSLPIFPSQ